MNENSKFIKANGITLHYIEQGEGELVILLHGFPDFWFSWRKQIPELSKHYRVVAPDMRGYNLSEKPPLKSDYNIKILAKDIEQLILNLGEKKAVVIGHDWGGIVAWAVASLHPEVVKKLIIINAPHLSEMRKTIRGFKFKQLLKSWYVFFFQLPYIPEKLIGSEKFFKNEFSRMYVRDISLSDEEVEKYVNAFAQPNSLKCSINYYRAALPEVLGKETIFPKVKAPVLILWGEKDKALGKELTYGNDAYTENPCQIIYDTTSGHFPHQENEEWINEKILHFIKS